MQITYGAAKSIHRSIDMRLVEERNALFLGGEVLLKNRAVLERIMPSYDGETGSSYNDRLLRASYENAFGNAISTIVAGLAIDPVRLKAKDDAKLDEFWSDFATSASPPDHDRVDAFDVVLREGIQWAQVHGISWIAIDMPKAPPAETIASLADQEAAGVLRPYLVVYRPGQVTNWSARGGKLNWIRTYSCVVVDDDPASIGTTKRHTWITWTPTEFFVHEKDIREGEQQPDDRDIVPLVGRSPHSFGRVPFVAVDLNSLNLCAGRWIDSVQRALMNIQNGGDLAMLRDGTQTLYEFLGPEMAGIDSVISEKQTDPGRAGKKRGVGIAQIRGADDRAEYIGPNMTGTTVRNERIGEMRDSIMRVTGQMAMANDTRGEMLRRSGDSKRQDRIATEIVLGALGSKVVRPLAKAIVEIVASSVSIANVPEIVGAETFDIDDAGSMAERMTLVEAAGGIPSATYNIERAYQLAIRDLGAIVTPEMSDAIREELKTAFTQDQIIAAKKAKDMPPPPPGFDDKEDDDGPPPPKS